MHLLCSEFVNPSVILLHFTQASTFTKLTLRHTLLQNLGNILDESLINKLLFLTAAKALLNISCDQSTIFILRFTIIDSFAITLRDST
jgi:hypothetical protein